MEIAIVCIWWPGFFYLKVLNTFEQYVVVDACQCGWESRGLPDNAYTISAEPVLFEGNQLESVLGPT